MAVFLFKGYSRKAKVKGYSRKAKVTPKNILMWGLKPAYAGFCDTVVC